MMRTLVNFILGRTDGTLLRFHYLRVGASKPLLDTLKDQFPENELDWVQHEVNAFREYHFSSSYGEHNAAVVNMYIDVDEITGIRRDFWENFVWKTENIPLPLAIVVPSSQEYGSMTKAEIYEALSLVRLNDRPVKLFEFVDGVAEEVTTWLIDLVTIVHRKDVNDE